MPRKQVEKPSKLPETVAEAAETGDRLTILRTMRDRLAKDMDAAESNVVAQIAARLQAVLVAIAELEPPEVVPNGVDQLAQRREDRISAAHVAGSSVRRVRQRSR
jgi:phage gp29-like protein